jgi:PBP1b-binding outer membrane lipoprotein LpoB
MKKLAMLLLISLVFTSCASHHGLPKNYNQNTTEVVLTKNNFKVVSLIKGEAEATYIFGFGGLNKNGLISEAKAQMLENSGMVGSSKTIINEVVEVKRSGFLFVNKYKVIVSAQLVEFIQ